MRENSEKIKKEDALEPFAITRIVLPPVINLPCLHHTKFAELNGLSEGVVGGWIDNGYLPTVKIGRYTMINLVQLSENLKKGDVL